MHAVPAADPAPVRRPLWLRQCIKHPMWNPHHIIDGQILYRMVDRRNAMRFFGALASWQINVKTHGSSSNLLPAQAYMTLPLSH